MPCCLPKSNAPSQMKKQQQSIMDTYILPDCEQDRIMCHAYIKEEKYETSTEHLSVENEVEPQSEDQAVTNIIQNDRQNHPLPTDEIDYSVATPMNQYFIHLFEAMMRERCLNKAVDLLMMIPLQIPTVEVLRRLLHDILMESEDEAISLKALVYAFQLLNIYPPWNSERRNYYLKALFQSEASGPAAWHAVADIIRCCFQRCNIESDLVIKKKACEDQCLKLFKYIVAVVERDFKESVSASSVSTSSRSLSETMICRLFWPSGDINCISYSLQELMNFLDDIFANKDTGHKVEFLESVITLFAIAADFAFIHANCSEIEILGNACKPLAQIQQKIAHCRFISASRENLEFLLSRLPFIWLKIKICESLLNDMVYNKWDHISKPITLRKIVECFMYPRENTRNTISDDEDFSPPRKKRKVEERKTIKGQNELHTACKKNLPGSLQELLLKSEFDVNAVDSLGRTPLHIACLANSFLCCNVLLRGRKKEGHFQKPDLFIQDSKGDTPLHIAVRCNNADIIELLIQCGGEGLTSIRNDKNCTPLELAKTAQVRNILKEHSSKEEKKVPQKIVISDLRHLPEERNPPSLCLGSGCSMYLFCFNTMLQNYVKFFQLQDLKAKVNENLEISSVIKTYLQKQFDYVTNSNDVFNACDDLLVLRDLPEIIQKFCKQISECCPCDHDAQEELLCLKFQNSLL